MKYIKPYLQTIFVILLIGNTTVLQAGRKHPKPAPSLLRSSDILIWDEQYLRGKPKGWTVPADYHDAFGSEEGISGRIRSDARWGRFGLLSTRFIYTSWRNYIPLSNSELAEGKRSSLDTHTSNLITPHFEIKRDYITFLISGGYAPAKACINLLVDGKVLRSATGNGSDFLQWEAFDVKSLKGSQAQIQVLDTSILPKDYVTVDCIAQSPDTKNALRVISAPPKEKVVISHLKTLDGNRRGEVSLVEGGLLLDKKTIDMESLLSWRTETNNIHQLNERMVLLDGSIVTGKITGMEKSHLIINNKILGEKKLAINNIAQVLFSPGPPVNAKPGTLIHEKGTKIPGKITWIRKDTIALKCALGLMPLPRGRVRAFVYEETRPTQMVESIQLTDGSILYGKLTFTKETINVKHASLGIVKLMLASIAGLNLQSTGVTSLSELKVKSTNRLGAYLPPTPKRRLTETGEQLKVYPRTAITYDLPIRKKNYRLLGTLVPLTNSTVPVSVKVRFGKESKNFTLEAGSKELDLSINLGTAKSFELIVDSITKGIYPCGVELHNAFVIEVDDNEI